MASTPTSAVAAAQDETKPTIFQNPHPQTESPLFSTLPPELRWEIFRLALTPVPDVEKKAYPFLSYYYRPPTHIADRKYDLRLLLTCRRIYNEAVEKLGFPGIVCDDETFYWGWFERRPHAYRYETVGDGWAPRGSESEDGEEWEGSELGDEDGDEGEWDEEEEEGLEEEERDGYETPDYEPVVPEYVGLGSTLGESSLVSGGHMEEEPLVPGLEGEPESLVADEDMAEDDEEEEGEGSEDDSSEISSIYEEQVVDVETRARELQNEDHSPWKSSSTDHPFQLPRYREYKPYHWASIKTITIFPQLFSFSSATFSQFFGRAPHLRPTTVKVVVRYTDWWSWEHNQPLDITNGMEPGFRGRVILPSSVKTFILELETRDGKKSELDSVIRSMHRHRRSWKWARQDGRYLEMIPGVAKEWEWMGPTYFYDENCEDLDNYYRSYRFEHHPRGREMRYVARRLVWKEGGWAGNAKPEGGKTFRFGDQLGGYRALSTAGGSAVSAAGRVEKPVLLAPKMGKRSFDDYSGEDAEVEEGVAGKKEKMALV